MRVWRGERGAEEGRGRRGAQPEAKESLDEMMRHLGRRLVVNIDDLRHMLPEVTARYGCLGVRARGGRERAGGRWRAALLVQSAERAVHGAAKL
jgi:hypothetical protein